MLRACLCEIHFERCWFACGDCDDGEIVEPMHTYRHIYIHPSMHALGTVGDDLRAGLILFISLHVLIASYQSSAMH